MLIKNYTQVFYTRIMLLWMIFVSIILISFNSLSREYINFGPSDDLVFIGISINNNLKYTLLILYTCFNSVLRTLNIEIVYPWVMNVLQDISKKDNDGYVMKYGYEIAITYILYTWFDWVISLIIVFTQLDLLICEICFHIITTLLTTRYYITPTEQKNETRLLLK